jgi:DNA-binding transcriptional regulator YbjK
MTSAARHPQLSNRLVPALNVGGVSGERSSRRDLIAEAVIELLAREGGRGLTHGNVDARLDLPKGSTSFYFRRRAELFEAGLRKLVAEDLEQLHDALDPLYARYPGPIPVKEVARRHYALWREQTRSDMRTRMMARFEFFLQAARDPQFARFHDEVRTALFDFGSTMFARMGAKNPRRAAVEYGYLFLSVSLANFFVPPSIGGHRLTTAYYERCLHEIANETNQLPTVAVESVRRARSSYTRRRARSRG